MYDPIVSCLLVLVGLVALVGGGELLVRGASSLAAALHVPPLMIGLTIVAFGTSAPELGVSLQAAAADSAELAVGNVVGSNIFNVLFILGLSALVAPLIVDSRLVRIEVPLMIGATVLTYFLARDGDLGRVDGLILATVLGLYLLLCYLKARSGSRELKQAHLETHGEGGATSRLGWRRFIIYVAQMVGGLALLVVGSKWLVDGAVSLATAWGVSQLVIGLTIVATGTSLPEVVTSVIASLRGQRDIAVGNVVGSNVFNLGLVLGFSGLVAPHGIPVTDAAIAFDMPIMIAVAVMTLPILFTGGVIARWEGALLLFYYVAYTALLILMQTQAELAAKWQWLLLWCFIPATVLILAVSLIRALLHVSSKGKENVDPETSVP